MSGGGLASPFGEGGSRRLGDLETSPETARNMPTKAAQLAEMRELNQRRARLIRNLGRVYEHGRRTTTIRLDALPLLEEEQNARQDVLLRLGLAP